MRTAISAFACTENRGSEHELGWKCLKELASTSSEVQLFTSERVNPNIRSQVENNGLKNVNVHAVDFPDCLDRLLKSIPGTGYQLAAYFWEFLLFAHLLRFYKSRHFDLAVKSTYGSYRWPSFLWYFAREFHLDPVSGGGGFPYRFKAFFSPKARRRELFRLFMQRAAFFDPFILMTLFKADKLFVGNHATKNIMPQFARRKCVVKEDFLKVDARDFRIEEARERCRLDPSVLKIFQTGKLLEWKGVMIVLRALAKVPDDVAYEYTVMGTGPGMELYQHFVATHGLNVKFVDPSNVPRPDLSFYFLSNDLFTFPTLHGESGFAPVEAKLHGIRLLTLDFSGLGDVLTEEDICIATEGKSAEDVVDAISHEITHLYRILKQAPEQGADAAQ